MTREQIEADSNLIQAAKQLGGTFKLEDGKRSIELPCGRVANIESFGTVPQWNLFIGDTRHIGVSFSQALHPERIARSVRNLVVRHDNFLERLG